MADRTIKPDDTNDLVLQNNHGGAKIEINEGDGIQVTIGSASDDDFNVGSGKLVVEGDTGNVGVGVSPSDQGTGRTHLHIHSSSTDYSYISLTNNTSGSDATANGTNILSDGNNFKILNRESGGDITLQTTGTGDVNVNTGNLVIGTAGKGIDFSAQTATSATGATTTSELLDHYEEGTATLVWKFGTTTQSSTQFTHYTKIGRIVCLQSRIYMDNAPSGGGDATLEGLPFATANVTDTFQSVRVGYQNLIAGDCYLSAEWNASKVTMGKVVESNSSSTSNLSNGDFAQYSQLRFTFVYITS
tara:strand:- start:993 stop:1898 length:906 start_codon:yes stop_codon:yes gene_type:complete